MTHQTELDWTAPHRDGMGWGWSGVRWEQSNPVQSNELDSSVGPKVWWLRTLALCVYGGDCRCETLSLPLLAQWLHRHGPLSHRHACMHAWLSQEECATYCWKSAVTPVRNDFRVFFFFFTRGVAERMIYRGFVVHIRSVHTRHTQHNNYLRHINQTHAYTTPMNHTTRYIDAHIQTKKLWHERIHP